MKKTIIIALAIAFMATTSFAGSMTLGSTDPMTVGLSNEVTATYVAPGDATSKPQWYAIGTYHAGGDKAYATAQDITNIYYQTKDPGEDVAWTGLPQDSASSNVWSADVWKAL